MNKFNFYYLIKYINFVFNLFAYFLMTKRLGDSSFLYLLVKCIFLKNFKKEKDDAYLYWALKSPKKDS
jgi:hypothetical protein